MEFTKKAQDHKKGLDRLFHRLREQGRRVCAVLLCAGMVISGLPGSFFQAFASERSEDFCYELDRESLYEAVRTAVLEGTTVDGEPDFTGEYADQYKELFNADGTLYELKDLEVKKDRDRDRVLDLRAFVRLEGDIPLDGYIEPDGEESVIFLLSNRSKDAASAIIYIDELETETIEIVSAASVSRKGGPGAKAADEGLSCAAGAGGAGSGSDNSGNAARISAEDDAGSAEGEDEDEYNTEEDPEISTDENAEDASEKAGDEAGGGGENSKSEGDADSSDKDADTSDKDADTPDKDADTSDKDAGTGDPESSKDAGSASDSSDGSSDDGSSGSKPSDGKDASESEDDSQGRDHSGRNDHTDRNDNSARGGHPDKNDDPGRSDRPDRSDNFDKGDRPEQSVNDHSDKEDHSNNRNISDKSAAISFNRVGLLSAAVTGEIGTKEESAGRTDAEPDDVPDADDSDDITIIFDDEPDDIVITIDDGADGIVMTTDSDVAITSDSEVTLASASDADGEDPSDIESTSDEIIDGEIYDAVILDGRKAAVAFVTTAEELGLDKYSRLEDQTIEAKIYEDDSCSWRLADGTGITLTGIMPVDAEVKAYPVEVEIEDVNILAAYDITIFDKHGKEFQPDEDDAIEVLIENDAIYEALDDEHELTVYHMEDEFGEPEEIAMIKPAPRRLQVLSFLADRFSIYIVGTDGTLTDENGENTDTYTVNFYAWVYDSEADSDDEDPITSERVVGDDHLSEPEVPEIEHHVFDGWFTEEQKESSVYPGCQYDFEKTVNENLTEWGAGYIVETDTDGNRVINLYSDYDPIYYVYYMTEEEFDETTGVKTNEDVVVFTDEYHENNSTLDTSSAESVYQQSHLNADQAVTSWYYYDGNNERQSIKSGARITDNLTLYPLVQDVIWVYFYMGEEAGENVEAVAPIYIPADANTFGELPKPGMSGYDFAGWYFRIDEDEKNDKAVTSASDPQEFISDDKKDIDLYAHWTPASVAYTVNIWRQKATDGQEGIDQKTVQDGEKYETYIRYYDYAESITVDADKSELKTGDTNISTSQFGTTTTGNWPNQRTVEIWSEWTGYGWTTGSNGSDGTGDYVGFEYNRTRTENDLETVTVQADGSTIINIFYDRVTVTYHFTFSNNRTSTYTGLYDTNFTEWPDPGTNTQWRYQTDRSYSNNPYTGMSFLAKFTLTENYLYRSNEVHFSTSSTSSSSTLFYYLEVTDPDRQLTGSDTTRIENGITYVLDKSFSFGWGDRNTQSTQSMSFNISDKYIGYTAEYFSTSANGGFTEITSQNNPVSLGNNSNLYIFNNAVKYSIDLYSNHNGEQLIETKDFKYGEDLAGYDLPSDLDAGLYGPNYYYHFTGTWYEDPNFAAEFVKPDTMPANNLAAYADWELDEVTVTFLSYVDSDLYDKLAAAYKEENVTELSSGGEGSDDAWAYSIVITAGDRLDYTLDIGFSAAEDQGHSYEYGGLINNDSGNVFNFATQIYTDTGLMLFWIEKQVVYHIQYHLNKEDGTATVIEELGHGHESTSWAEVRELTEVFTDLEDISDEGFICWNTMADGSGINYYPDDDVDFTSVVATPVFVKDGDGNDTDVIDYYVYNLYAIWAEEKTTSLTLDYNYPEGYDGGETRYESVDVEYLGEVELISHLPVNETIVVNGVTWHFAGWAYSDDATEASVAPDAIVAVDNVGVEEGGTNVLYAVWERAKVYPVDIFKYTGGWDTGNAAALPGAEFILSYVVTKIDEYTGDETEVTYYGMFEITDKYSETFGGSIYCYTFTGCTEDRDEATKLISGADGFVHMTDLSAETKYCLTEIKAPDGYQLLKDAIEFTVLEGGYVTEDTVINAGIYKDRDIITLCIGNASGFELPAAGGLGTLPFRALGTFLTGSALWLLFLTLRRKRRWA